MIKTYSDLKTVHGKEVFIERAYAGWVTFKVLAVAEDFIHIKSTSLSGYDMTFSGDNAVKDFEEYAASHFLFASIEDAVAHDFEQAHNFMADFKAKYTDDKDAFMRYLIEQTYLFQLSPEYGDQTTAMAIKEVAEGYFPDIELGGTTND